MSPLEQSLREFFLHDSWPWIFAVAGAVLFAFVVASQWQRLVFLRQVHDSLRPHVLREYELIKEGGLTKPKLGNMARVVELMLRADGIEVEPIKLPEEKKEEPPADEPAAPEAPAAN